MPLHFFYASGTNGSMLQVWEEDGGLLLDLESVDSEEDGEAIHNWMMAHNGTNAIPELQPLFSAFDNDEELRDWLGE